MVKNRLSALVFTCKGPLVLIRCFDLGLKPCNIALQHAYASFEKLLGTFTYLCGFDHRTIGILDGNIGGYIDLRVVCVIVVSRVRYAFRKIIRLG